MKNNNHLKEYQDKIDSLDREIDFVLQELMLNKSDEMIRRLNNLRSDIWMLSRSLDYLKRELYKRECGVTY